MIPLHVLATKLRTKASVPIVTSMAMKPSGQKESRRTSFLRCVRVGVPSMMVRTISNTSWVVTPLGRMEVFRDVELPDHHLPLFGAFFTVFSAQN
jgi:hypothetical protein